MLRNCFRFHGGTNSLSIRGRFEPPAVRAGFSARPRSRVCVYALANTYAQGVRPSGLRVAQPEWYEIVLYLCERLSFMKLTPSDFTRNWFRGGIHLFG